MAAPKTARGRSRTGQLLKRSEDSSPDTVAAQRGPLSCQFPKKGEGPKPPTLKLKASAGSA
jgi:hypothetical protein